MLTGFPDYPGGHVYPGWRQRWRHETHSERLTVRRVPRYAGGDGLHRRADGRLPLLRRQRVAGRRAATWPTWTRCTSSSCRPPRSPPPACCGCFGQVPAVLHVQDVWARGRRRRGGRRPLVGAVGRRHAPDLPAGRAGGGDRAVDARPGGRRRRRPGPGADWCSTGPTSGSSSRRRPGRAARQLVRRDGRVRGHARRHHRRTPGAGDGGTGGGGAGRPDGPGPGRFGRGRSGGSGGSPPSWAPDNVRFRRAAVTGGHARAVRRRRLPAGHAA